jgi:hypothetical protein
VAGGSGIDRDAGGGRGASRDGGVVNVGADTGGLDAGGDERGGKILDGEEGRLPISGSAGFLRLEEGGRGAMAGISDVGGEGRPTWGGPELSRP